MYLILSSTLGVPIPYAVNTPEQYEKNDIIYSALESIFDA